MGRFDDLLAVQEHDTAMDRLRHRRANLPELADLARTEDEQAGVEKALTEVTARRDEVARRQKRLEDELAAVEAKVAEVEARMYSGAVTVPRELQAMGAEVEAMRRRCSVLEDGVLEAMGEREPLDDEVEALGARSREHDATAARLRVTVAEEQACIDGELAAEQAARGELAATLPADLAALYERLRAKLGGVGAARLASGRCTGCHLTLPATEVDRLRKEPPDVLVQCDQCSRILVR